MNANVKKSGKGWFVLAAGCIVLLIMIMIWGGGRKIEGVWEYTEGGHTLSMTFLENGEGYMQVEDEIIDYSYTYDDDILTIKTPDTLQRYGQVVTAECKINNDAMTLTDLNDYTSSTFYKVR